MARVFAVQYLAPLFFLSRQEAFANAASSQCPGTRQTEHGGDNSCEVTSARDHLLLQAFTPLGVERVQHNFSQGRIPDCVASRIQRRRRVTDMCSCRRRESNRELPDGLECIGNVIDLGNPGSLPASPPSGNAPGSRISVSGRRLLVDGKPFHMKGINWNPIGWNKSEPRDRSIDYLSFVTHDGDLMAAAGINVIRTYGPLTEIAVLDALWARGIWVMNTVFSYGLAEATAAVDVVNAVKNHPAILMWVIGNEWNYNGIYADIGFSNSLRKINEVADLIKQHDTLHPVSSIYGAMPSSDTVNRMPNIDVWGLNVYNGLSFGSLFDEWKGVSGKPMYLGEYGADCFNSIIDDEDQQAQADATAQLTNEIVANSAVQDGGSCIGGLLFEFADEWWKDKGGSAEEHDNHGIAPGGGPHPDKTFNEEWWGIVEITRKPRLAYYTYQKIENPGYSGAPVAAAAVAPVLDFRESCTPSQIQRRRRHVDMCSCRRRDVHDGSADGWKCQGPSIVPQ